MIGHIFELWEELLGFFFFPLLSLCFSSVLALEPIGERCTHKAVLWLFLNSPLNFFSFLGLPTPPLYGLNKKKEKEKKVFYLNGKKNFKWQEEKM